MPCLSQKEAVKLLHSPDTDTLVGQRDHALLFCFFKTAARCSTFAKVCVGHLERDVAGSTSRTKKEESTIWVGVVYFSLNDA